MVKILFKKADCGVFHSEVMSTGDVGNYESTFVSATSRLKRGGGCVCACVCVGVSCGPSTAEHAHKSFNGQIKFLDTWSGFR